MASNGKSTGITEGEISQQDAKFIVECLKNLDRNKQVDLVKVGETLGYTNAASVGNRFRLLRKRYRFTNLECTNISSKTEDKPSTAPTKANGKAKGAASTSTATKAAEAPSSEPSDDGEPQGAVKRQRPAKTAARRKGAKVSSKAIPATAPVSRNGAGASKSKGVAKALGNEGINSHLLEAVDQVMQEEELVDADGYNIRRRV